MQNPQVSTPKADAFVVFDSPHTANAAAQMKFSIENGMRTRLAPSPRDVYDKNIGYHGWAGFDARFFFTVVFYILLILFWAVRSSSAKRENINHFSFSCFSFVTQIARMSLVSRSHTPQKNHSKINA